MQPNIYVRLRTLAYLYATANLNKLPPPNPPAHAGGVCVNAMAALFVGAATGRGDHMSQAPEANFFMPLLLCFGSQRRPSP
jgi:hypothetical protein